MARKCFVLVGLVAVLALLIGCAGPTRLEMDYGTSYKLAKFNQILNPEAEKNLEPVAGFDGKAAQFSITKYQKSFEERPVAPVYQFNIGTTGR